MYLKAPGTVGKLLSQRGGGGGGARVHFCQNSFLLIENKHLFQLLYLKLLIKKIYKSPLNDPALTTKTMKLRLKKKYSAPFAHRPFRLCSLSFWNFPVCKVQELLSYMRNPLWDNQREVKQSVYIQPGDLDCTTFPSSPLAQEGQCFYALRYEESDCY